MTTILRDATEDDLPSINDIYNHYVLNSVCTYQNEPTPLDERRRWFGSLSSRHPVIVAESNGAVIGWGALTPFNEREAYRHTVEDSVYVAPDQRGRGLGSAILSELLTRASAAGHHSVIAKIDSEQRASIALHEKHGFVEAGRLREVGHKFGRWLDVILMERIVSSAAITD